jgi:hypothetical protein
MKIIMKKSILLNEDEKSRILNLHETAKNLYENKKPVSSIKEDKSKKENMKKVIKLTESDLEKIVRRVIEEQYMGVAFGGEQNGLKIKKGEFTEQQQSVVPQEDNKVKYKNLVAKVDSYLPFDSKKLQNTMAQIKSGAGPLINVAQPFLEVQKLLEKINPQGYREATTSSWKNYKSNIFNTSVAGNDKSVYVSAINDLVNMKSALRNKAAELSGMPSTMPAWAKTEVGKKLVDMVANQAGISNVA